VPEEARTRKRKNEAFDAYIWVESADTTEFEAKLADLITRPQLQSYGMKEFDVRDRDGFVLRFGEDVPRS
jgi:hypothetical protein